MTHIWLILDTACPRALVAVARGNHVLAQVYLDEYRKHGERLPKAVESCLGQVSLTLGDIGAIAVGVGPGSFIGVRIAMAYAKGLSIALGVALVGFNTLAGIEGHGAEWVAIDARRGEYYGLAKGCEQAVILKTLPENAHLEPLGPTGQKVVSILPNTIENQVFNLVPNYIRESQC